MIAFFMLGVMMMKKLAAAVCVSLVALTGCATNKVVDERAMIVDGEAVKVKVQDIRSFQVEIAPRKAVCHIKNTAGHDIQSECLQYRNTFNRNYNILSGDIEGFIYEPGYRYVLDVKQTALLNQVTGVVVPVWSLNKIVSKTAETL